MITRKKIPGSPRLYVSHSGEPGNEASFTHTKPPVASGTGNEDKPPIAEVCVSNYMHLVAVTAMANYTISTHGYGMKLLHN